MAAGATAEQRRHGPGPAAGAEPAAVAPSPAAPLAPAAVPAAGPGYQPAAAPAASAPLAAHRTALLIALALLLGVVSLLFASDPDARTGRVGAAMAVLRGAPPQSPVQAGVQRGLGRYRAERTGRPPTL